jgi:SAM-dependent methyltransferase
VRPDPERRIFLGQPGYGHVTAGASLGFWRATRLPDKQVTYRYREGSLLAANFNQLWCDALNLVDSGRRLDYFAMIHADVEPTPGWLDVLVEEMEERDLDVLGVVVPLKDQRGTTSLALDHPTGDPFRITARLTMHEVYRLPETFTSEDVGRPLLLNTGLWACRWDQEWARCVSFTISDRIAYDTGLGRYVAQCEPEDWRFSRLLHEIGRPGSPTEGRRPLRVGATRRVPVKHRGDQAFHNWAPWGTDEFDKGWTDHSPLDDRPAHGEYELPRDVPGWLTTTEGEALSRLARGRRVLEVGSYLGLSTICLARTAESVVSIDPHDGRGTACPGDTYDAFIGNLRRHGVAERVRAIRGTTRTVDPAEVGGPFDLVFIDGAHDRESVACDIALSLRWLAPGGLLAFHDYRSEADPGVTEAVDNLIGAGGRLLSTHRSVAVVAPPAELLQPQEV